MECSLLKKDDYNQNKVRILGVQDKIQTFNYCLRRIMSPNRPDHLMLFSVHKPKSDELNVTGIVNQSCPSVSGRSFTSGRVFEDDFPK